MKGRKREGEKTREGRKREREMERERERERERGWERERGGGGVRISFIEWAIGSEFDCIRRLHIRYCSERGARTVRL